MSETIKTLPELLELTGITPATMRRAMVHGFVTKSRAELNLLDALVGLVKFFNSLYTLSELPTYENIHQCSTRTGIPESVIKEARRAQPEVMALNRIALEPLLRWIFSQDADGEARVNWKDELAKW